MAKPTKRYENFSDLPSQTKQIVNEWEIAHTLPPGSNPTLATGPVTYIENYVVTMLNAQVGAKSSDIVAATNTYNFLLEHLATGFGGTTKAIGTSRAEQLIEELVSSVEESLGRGR